MTLAQLIANAKAEGWAQAIRSEADERAVLDGHRFDEKAAQHAVDFFERFLLHSMGDFAGQPFRLLDWQRDEFIRPLFGWRRRDGRRRFSKGDIFVAKKQGKSTLAAGINNYLLMTGGKRAECYGVAHTREQAGIIYRESAAMVRNSPGLKKYLNTRDSQKRIIYPDNGSFYQALAGEACAKGVEGINPVLVIFDEIHVQRSRTLYDALAYASIARPDSLFLSVSTVGVADQTTIWWEQYQYAKGILSGAIYDPARFALIYQADEGCKDDPTMRADERQWRKAMPSLGATVQAAKIAEQVREAENSPKKLGNLLRYIFNLPTATVDKVVPMNRWNAAAVETAPDLRGRRCFGGLDMASCEDLASFVLVFPPVDGGKAFVKVFAWCPEDKIRDREMRQQSHYRQWVNDGWLLETGGNRIDHRAIEDVMREACEDYDVAEIGFDPWNADAVVNPLMAEGYSLTQVQQTLGGLSTGTTALLSAISEETLEHEGNPVAGWCLQNCAADDRDDAVKFSKKRSAEKIDIAQAMSMAFGRWKANTSAELKPMIF